MSINPAQAQRRLLRGRDIIVALCADLEDADWRWRPAPGKWSFLEVVNHLADEERDDSLLWLGNLGSVDWLATYDHPSGPLRAGDLLLSWMIHDDLHARQMLRLHHDHCLATAAPFSAAYAGPW